ncbi:bifunctional phosphoribosyl-AMP cyclohydrolase/phosphoribosyl-ATP diphosphatase HisIE [Dyella mobilis]|uniref:bifunctional phosphoribosyl-AMP cyclohydrolase/phosphoribosyl-ATP diphosphatase HisIE n=1 Tax=Dyella mobilis TaxID=1849582 RepID=UPI0024E072D7|nr:bifunctional phosphoribosyl-AMP cyclohydrolase/phosphoribosyl-ATP diphosphatase HisIE [Dyella mobilis]
MTDANTTASRTDLSRLDWSKSGGLLPAIVQHWLTGEVLMLGYVNAEALAQTEAIGKVTFYSRSKQRLWMKGESSGHVLDVKSIRADCDSDTVLILANPQGPTCHLGTSSCFGDDVRPPLGFLAELDALVEQRKALLPEGSYTTRLFQGGTRRIAQKVGEEGVETALAAVAQGDEELLGEAADLIFHLTVLLRARGYGLADVARVLVERHG